MQKDSTRQHPGHYQGGHSVLLVHIAEKVIATNNIHRRIARRGGTKRISTTIYQEVRSVLKDRLTKVRSNGFVPIATSPTLLTSHSDHQRERSDMRYVGFHDIGATNLTHQRKLR